MIIYHEKNHLLADIRFFTKYLDIFIQNDLLTESLKCSLEVHGLNIKTFQNLDKLIETGELS